MNIKNLAVGALVNTTLSLVAELGIFFAIKKNLPQKEKNGGPSNPASYGGALVEALQKIIKKTAFKTICALSIGAIYAYYFGDSFKQKFVEQGVKSAIKSHLPSLALAAGANYIVPRIANKVISRENLSFKKLQEKASAYLGMNK